MARFHSPIVDNPRLKKMGVTNNTHCYGMTHDWHGPTLRWTREGGNEEGFKCFNCGLEIKHHTEMPTSPDCIVQIIPRSWLPSAERDRQI